MNSANILDLAGDGNFTMLEHVIGDGRAWTRDSVGPESWTVNLTIAALKEVKGMLAAIRRDPLPTILLTADQFELPACAEAMGKIKSIVAGGLGVAVLDRLPMDEMTIDEAKAVYWVLGQFLGTEVAQKWDGTMLYDVTDTGANYGYGVRGSWTDVELFFHTDNAFGIAPPDFVSLLCINPAERGGVSRFCSLYTIHNELLQNHPEQLRRLYEPCIFDRQAEHAPGDPRLSRSPAFRFDGKRLKARLAASLVRKAHDLIGEELDHETGEALAVMDELMADRKLWMEFTIERGQMQFLNNREVAHFRSSFEDSKDQALKRHLIRLWYREGGRRSYNG